MEIQVKGSSTKCSFSRLYFFEIWASVSGHITTKHQHVMQVFLENLNNSELDPTPLEKCLLNLCKSMDNFWKKVHCAKSKFLKKYADWLNVVECVEFCGNDEQYVTTEVNFDQPDTSSGVRGRPRKEFSNLSQRSKRRRLADLSKLDSSTVDALLQVPDTDTGLSTNISADEVLSLFVEAKLTKHQYLLIKNFINSKTACNILPSYHSVIAAKKKCYPENVNVTDAKAEVQLQSLLDHTASRLLESQSNLFDHIPLDALKNLKLIGKWGFDGSTGHSEYKQSFMDSDLQDSSLFVTSYVPLQLVVDSDSQDRIVLWKNPRPSSTRYCRPVRIQFVKETSAVSKEEETYYKEKIANLHPTTFTLKGRVFTIQHFLQLTMVDGKICSALSESSSSRCYICEATPKEMNKIDICLQKQIKELTFEFGLSPLHSWIRFFEYFVHLSYRIEIKKWQVRSEEDKCLLAERKQIIQNQFRAKLGLIVDKPRSGGSGTSNDGNTARKFFKYSSISAEITGLRKDLIDRCSVILETLSSGYNINPDKFQSYALQTARMLVNEYPWYNLPASVHKVLIHGSNVINHAILSIGELSEEAAESNNKNLKAFRRDHTRKMSREISNTDLLNRLILNSDPYITGLRKLPQKKKSMFSNEVLDLLQL